MQPVPICFLFLAKLRSPPCALRPSAQLDFEPCGAPVVGLDLYFADRGGKPLCREQRAGSLKDGRLFNTRSARPVVFSRHALGCVGRVVPHCEPSWTKGRVEYTDVVADMVFLLLLLVLNSYFTKFLNKFHESSDMHTLGAVISAKL